MRNDPPPRGAKRTARDRALRPPRLGASRPYQRLLRAETEPQNWLTYSGNYNAHRYSALNQINRQNVGQTQAAWMYQLQRPGVVETSPIVVDGVMYITEPPSTVTALDVRSGPAVVDVHADDSRRRHHHRLAAGQSRRRDPGRHGVRRDRCTGISSRSTRSPARCAGTSSVDDNKHGYYLTLAPLALNGKIIVGVSGAETGIRGFVDAYDAKTGKLVWRTYTIPAPGEPGSETWGGESWKIGGGSTWLTGSFDPELNLLYWATGNPGARLERRRAAGRQPLHLLGARARSRHRARSSGTSSSRRTTCTTGTRTRSRCCSTTRSTDARASCSAVANRNAFYYVLDRETGEFLSATPYAKQTWADGIDAKGRPIAREQGSAERRGHDRVSESSGRRPTGTARATARRRSCSTSSPAR